MIEPWSILQGMTKALAILAAHDAVPGTIEVSRSTFEALKRECHYVNQDTSIEPNSFMGVKIVVKD